MQASLSTVARSTVSRMSGGGHFRGPWNGESASAICRFTNSQPSTHGRNPATPGPIDDSTPNASTPSTIRPEGGHRSSRTAVPDERMLDPQHRGASRNPITSTTRAAPDGWESSDLVPCGIRLVEPTSERVFIPPAGIVAIEPTIRDGSSRRVGWTMPDRKPPAAPDRRKNSSKQHAHEKTALIRGSGRSFNRFRPASTGNPAT